MARMPKVYYSLTLLILIIALSGCELRRNPEEIADPAPVSEIPPTLAPLGAVEALGAEATAVPTIISVQPTATVSNLAEGQAAPAPAEAVAPTDVAVDLSASAADTETPEESTASAEAIAPPAEEAATTEESVPAEVGASDEAIVVDATTTEDLPIGGPVAANPPANPSDGSYEVPAYAAGSHTVQPGDTLFGVAQRYGTTVEALAYANGLSNDVIYVGQVLSIAGDEGGNYPTPGNFSQPPVYQQPGVPGNSGNYHIVGPGETLYSIAMQYNSSVDAIASANRIDYPFTIKVGQQLMVPMSGNYAGPPQFEPNGPPSGNVPGPNGFYQPLPGNANLHVVAPGETLYAIALQYGISMDAIAGANSIPYPYTIGVGQQLLIPGPGAYAGSPPPADGYYQQQPPYQGYAPQAPAAPYEAAPDNYAPKVDDYGNGSRTHTVTPGETLYSIARLYNASADALAAANGLSNPNQLFVGQVLYLP